jgi:thiopeptide-type bacteriocin biosynthesis protein
MSGWSYVKIHHNPGPFGETTDRILCEAMAPSLREMREEGLYDAYFFLRYIDDTGPHLRLRTNKEALENRLRDSITLRLADIAPDSQIRSARYEPEVAKYGGAAGMALAEAQFHVSSEFALACLMQTRQSTGMRLLIGARELLWILEAAVAEPQRRAGVLACYSDYWKGFLRNSLQDPVPSLECDADMRVLGNETLADDGLAEALGLTAALSAWRGATNTILEELRALERTDRLTVALPHIALNFVHTFCNRLGLSIADELLMAALVRELGLI